MKGNDQIISKLNQLLADELTAINQYLVHSEMAENWGYEKLHQFIRERSITEMKHANRLIERILYLEGRPIVSNLNKITIGDDVPKALGHDLGLEYGAVKSYNEGAKLAAELGDHGTKELLEAILQDEEKHVDGIEAYQDQIQQMGLQVFLGTQT